MKQDTSAQSLFVPGINTEGNKGCFQTAAVGQEWWWERLLLTAGLLRMSQIHSGAVSQSGTMLAPCLRMSATEMPNFATEHGQQTVLFS